MSSDVFIQKQNSYLHGNIIGSIKVPAVFVCLHRCKMKSQCDAINYHKEMKQCELLHGNNIVDDLEKRENWIAASLVSTQCLL